MAREIQMLSRSSIRGISRYSVMLFALSGMIWGQANSCDVNSDGQVNVIDVQLIINMEINVPGFTCAANVGGILGCSDAARQTVIKAALGNGCHFIYLSWTASTSTGVVGYNIYRGPSSGGESDSPLNVGGPVKGTSFVDLTAVGSTKYYYYVKATDGITLSPASTETCAIAATDGVSPPACVIP